MNLPNKLTCLRVLLVPVIWIIYSIEVLRKIPVFVGSHLSVCNLIILIIALAGALLDFLDGKIARKTNQVTDFGKFLDPIADKLLTLSLFIIIYDQGSYYNIEYLKGVSSTAVDFTTYIRWWMLAIIIAREFIVTGVRLLGAGKKVVIPANIYGKAKTCLQFIVIFFLLVGCANFDAETSLVYSIFAYVLIILMLAATIISGADYVIVNFDLIKSGLKNEEKEEKKNKNNSQKSHSQKTKK